MRLQQICNLQLFPVNLLGSCVICMFLEQYTIPYVTSSHVKAQYYHDFCQGGWVLPRINQTMRAYVEEVNAKWHRSQLTTLSQLYNHASKKDDMWGLASEPTGWNRFDVMMPALPESCPSLARIGSSGDGGKLICGLDHVAHTSDAPCVVYSIGGNNQWDFETAIVDATPCSVFTFDCTVNGHVPVELQDRVVFHKICLGTGKGTPQNVGVDTKGEFMSLRDIMAMLGHTHITLLKADIEGYEYDMFDSMLRDTDMPLPEQISFELHYVTTMDGLDWWGRQKTAGELALFARMLYDAGYRVISRDDNFMCGHCTEFTVVRFRCPIDSSQDGTTKSDGRTLHHLSNPTTRLLD